MNQLPKDLILLLCSFLDYKETHNLDGLDILPSNIWEYKLWNEFKEKSKNPERSYLETYISQLSTNPWNKDSRFLEIEKLIRELQKEKNQIYNNYVDQSTQLLKEHLTKYGTRVRITLNNLQKDQLLDAVKDHKIKEVFQILGQDYPLATFLEIVNKEQIILYIFITIKDGELKISSSTPIMPNFDIINLPFEFINLINDLNINIGEAKKIFNL